MGFSPEAASRYSRHFVLKEIGVSGQKKLLSSKALVIGAGALGCVASKYLAAAGVGTIGICDYDRVELSNLQRQVLFGVSDIGKLKTEVAKESLGALNPDINIVTMDYAVTPENINELISHYDFVLDCCDRFETKFLISDACVLRNKPFCHAGVVRFGGQVMTYVPGAPCLRCFLGEIPRGAQTCATQGVLGSVTGIIGSVQATETIKYLLGIGELLTGKVLSVDALTMDIKVVKFNGTSEDCAVCSTHKITSVSANADLYKIKECEQ